MKKICLLLFTTLFFLFGCSNDSEDSVVKKINDDLKDIESYYLCGDLSIRNNEDKYNYDVEVYYKSDDYYRVNLVNVDNGHEQIILKNDDGVYVVTPSLNKSFKFQSNWPNDSSQVYLIESLYDDIFNCKERIFEVLEDSYLFTVDANYPNNSNLVKQNITFDKNLVLKSVEVYNENNDLQMEMNFSEIVINKDIDNDTFNLNNIINNLNRNEDSNSDSINDSTSIDDTVSSIDDIIYPLYIPMGTVLIDEEKIDKTDGERIILTFDGEKPFILVEETISVKDEFEIIPMQGEPYLILDSVASLSDNSISWINNGIEYYLVSDVMSQIELVEIANSVTTIEYVK